MQLRIEYFICFLGEENMLMHAVKDDYFICFLGKENMLMNAVKD